LTNGEICDRMLQGLTVGAPVKGAGKEKPRRCYQHPRARPKEVRSLSYASVPQSTGGAPTSVADSGFCGGLAEYPGTKPPTAETALLDKRAQRVPGVAPRATDKNYDHEERARTLMARGTRRGAGAFGPVQGEFVSPAGGVGRGGEPRWHENWALTRLLVRYRNKNPGRPARVLGEPEIRVNAFSERPQDEGGS
jgi:hypothetical protein